MNDLISLIVPIYNVEKYLKRCIDSILSQTYTNLEVILVDDGSPDNCGKICDEYANKDVRIKVIHKENGGLGYARNSGLDIATGEFVMFVDSDDFIMPNTCETLISALTDSNADFCYFEHYEYIDGEKIRHSSNILKQQYDGDDILYDFLANAIAPDVKESGKTTIGMSAWRIIYRRNLIEENKIRFYSEREYLSEDLLFRVELCKKSKKVISTNECLYCYCYNGESLTKKYRKDRFSAAVNLYLKLSEDCESADKDGILKKRCMRLLMNNATVCIKQEIAYQKAHGRKATLNNIKSICDNSTLQKILGEYPIKEMPLQNKLFFSAVKNRRVHFVHFLTSLKMHRE